MITELPTTIDMPDVCDDIDQAYFGKNKFGGDVAEIYAFRLVPRHRNRPITSGSIIWPEHAHDFTDQDAREAADNLAKLCKAYLVIHPDARFAYERHTARLFEDVDLDSDRPFSPFSHRIHLKVYPEPVENPRVVFLLTMKFSGKDAEVKPVSKFRIIVDPRDRPSMHPQVCDKDRLGGPKWSDMTDRRLESEILARTLLRMADVGPNRWLSDGVVYIDLGEQTWSDDV